MSFGLDGERVLASVDVTSPSFIAFQAILERTSRDFTRVVDLLERLEKPLKQTIVAIGVSTLIFSSASLLGRLSIWFRSNDQNKKTS
jgi:hypothetical protein